MTQWTRPGMKNPEPKGKGLALKIDYDNVETDSDEEVNLLTKRLKNFL